MTSKIVGLFPGAMKPVTVGHYSVIKKAAGECDEVHVYTSTKGRGSVSPETMKLAWDRVIIPTLPDNVDVHFTGNPVGAIYDHVKMFEGSDAHLKLYVGEGDVERFSMNRLSKVAPTLVSDDHVEVVLTPRLVSATNARDALDRGDFESFKKFVPQEIDAKVYWNTLKSDALIETLIKRLLARI